MNKRQNLKKNSLLLRSTVGIFDIYLKDYAKKVLKIDRSIVIENLKSVPPCPTMKLHKSPLLMANIMQSQVRDNFGNWKPWKNMKNAFYFILKALFLLKIFKFLSWVFGHVEKTVWLGREGQFQSLSRHNLVNKQLKYTYCLTSHELKARR